MCGGNDLNQQPANKGYRFPKGVSGNPAGRPVGARQKIVKSFVESLHARWLKEGDAMLDLLCKTDPSTVLRVIASLMPKDVAVSVEQRTPFNVDAGQWQMLRGVLDVIEQCAPTDAEPVEIFQIIEHALRSHWAKTVSNDTIG